MGFRFVNSLSYNGATYHREKTSSEYTNEYNQKVLAYNNCIDNLNVLIEEYDELEKKVKSWQDYLPKLESLKNVYNTVKTTALASNTSFANGGYIEGGTSLCSNEFSVILSTIDGTENVDLVYSETQARLKELEKSLETKKKQVENANSDTYRAQSAMNATYPKYKADLKK